MFHEDWLYFIIQKYIKKFNIQVSNISELENFIGRL